MKSGLNGGVGKAGVSEPGATAPRNSYYGAFDSSAESDVGDKFSGSRLARVQGQVEDLKQIMVKNIDAINERGEKLELLVDRTEDLQAGVSGYD